MVFNFYLEETVRSVKTVLNARQLNTLFNLARLYKALDNLRITEREEKDIAQGVRIIPRIDEDDMAQRENFRNFLHRKLKKLARYVFDPSSGKTRWNFGLENGTPEEKEKWTVELEFRRREREGAYICLLAVLSPGTWLYINIGNTERHVEAWEIADALQLKVRLMKTLGLKDEDDEVEEDEEVDEEKPEANGKLKEEKKPSEETV